MNLEQIDTSTTAGKAEVMRLAAEGRRVAYLSGWNGKWVACGSDPVTWNWESMEYAIIAEPVGMEEVWVVVGLSDGVFSKQGAEELAAEHPGTGVVKYIRADLAGEKG